MDILDYVIDPLVSLFNKPKRYKISKDAVYEQLMYNNTSLITHIKPSISCTRNKLSKLVTTDKDILKVFISAGIDEETVDDALVTLSKEIDGLITISNHMINMVSDYSPEYITNSTINPRIALVIHITNMLTSVVLFTPDLLLRIIDKSYDMDNMVEYRVALNYLRRDVLELIKEAKEIPQVTLDLLDTISPNDFKNSHLLLKHMKIRNMTTMN